MKTLRYRIGSEIRPGILDEDGKIRDASSLVSDWDADNIKVEKLNQIKNTDISLLPLVQNNDGIAPCVCKKSVGKIICIDEDNLGIKKSSINVYIDSKKYYIFVKMTKQITSQRDFLKKLLETL